ncbi:MAG: ROK family protein [Candidatus Saccharicenans sp.]|uniref:ROK family protein n=1 Tax=Candidatus Saccharicenans sp. TaxID=2819258 RepID=UPI00404A1CEF
MPEIKKIKNIENIEKPKSKKNKISEKAKPLVGAIDLGGTKIASALFNSGGQPVFRSRVPVSPEGGLAVLEEVISLYYQLEAEAARIKAQLKAVGLCVPGVVNPANGLVWAPNIPGWKDFQLLNHLRRNIGCPASVISDRTACVLGETWKGSAKNKKNVIFLAVGTGIGAGLMAEGVVIHGAGDLAGAVGWLALNREYLPEYAETGCFEWEASGGALARKARELLTRNPNLLPRTRLATPAADEVEIVCEAARQGKAEALELVREIQDYLAMGLANLISTLNPEVVVLGGGLFRSPDLFFEPLKKKFKKWAQPLAARSVKLVLSALGQEAALYGCARSAWLEIETAYGQD